MSGAKAGPVGEAWNDLLTAVEFLTRIPVPARPFAADSLARSTVYFPLVGLGVGALAGWCEVLLMPHVGRWGAGLGALTLLVLLTGALHEDALADAADGFGGGWTPEQILLILKDSRIGSYGATALGLSLVGRLVLLSTLPVSECVGYVAAAGVLSRWTVLPLGHFFPPAPNARGLGSRVAERTSRRALVAGSAFALVLVVPMLRMRAVAPAVAAVLVAAATGWYYRRRIGGVTGDCFGATVQLAEIAVLVCGVWQP